MSWQDWVLAIGSFIFVAALWPTLKSNDKPALATSMTTGSVLAIFTLTYLTLELWLAAFTTSMTATAWFILAYQKYSQKPNA